MSRATTTDSDPTGFGAALLTAVKDRKRELVLSLMAAGAPLTHIDRDGNTLLHIAAANGDAALVSTLLDKGANPLTENNALKTAIDLAAEKDDWEIVNIFINKTSREQAKHYSRVLYLAIGRSIGAFAYDSWLLAYETAHRLIEVGTSTESSDRDGNRPLHLAARKGSTALIKALLRAGADISVANADGHKPIQMALRSGADDSVRLFIQENPLNIAAYTGNTTRVSELLVDGSDLSIKNSDGDTPIKAAAHQGHWEIVTAIARFADTAAKQRDPDGFRQALLLASSSNQTESVVALLATNPTIYEGSTSGNSLLRNAIAHNNLPMLTALLDAGIHDEIANDADQTPLEYAKETFPENSRKECIAELNNAEKRDARNAAKSLKYPALQAFNLNLETQITRLNARALEIIKAEFARQTPARQRSIARHWGSELADNAALNFHTSYKPVVHASLAEEFKTQRIRPRALNAVTRHPTAIPLIAVLGEEFNYLVNVDIYKAKLRALKDECGEICRAAGAQFAPIATQIAAVIRAYLDQIDSATELTQLDEATEKGEQIKSVLTELRELTTNPANKIPSIIVSVDSEHLATLRAVPEQIRSLTREVGVRVDRISALKSIRFATMAQLPSNITAIFTVLSKERADSLAFLESSSNNSHSVSELEDIDVKIAELNKLDADLGNLLSYYDGKHASNSKRNDLVSRALMAFQYGFTCISCGISDYQSHIKATLDDCARIAQQDHHAATISFGLFGAPSRLASILSNMTGTSLLARTEARSSAAADTTSELASKDLPSKNEASKASRTATGSAAAASRGAASAAAEPEEDPIELHLAKGGTVAYR